MEKPRPRRRAANSVRVCGDSVSRPFARPGAARERDSQDSEARRYLSPRTSGAGSLVPKLSTEFWSPREPPEREATRRRRTASRRRRAIGSEYSLGSTSGTVRQTLCAGSTSRQSASSCL
jgi:hypothetical protein